VGIFYFGKKLPVMFIKFEDIGFFAGNGIDVMQLPTDTWVLFIYFF